MTVEAWVRVVETRTIWDPEAMCGRAFYAKGKYRGLTNQHHEGVCRRTWTRKYGPLMLSLTIWSKSSSEVFLRSFIGKMPALRMRMSILPKCLTVALTMVSIPLILPASAWTAKARLLPICWTSSLAEVESEA